MKRVGVAILGLGVVGGGTYKIISEHREFYQKTQNIDLVVESVLEPNESKISALGIKQEIVARNIAEVVLNPDVNIIVECIGGKDVAREYVLAALYAGKTVVTSNKLLYAHDSDELERVAKKHNAGLQLEASCMGGVPIVRTLLNGLQANVITSMIGIVNGTTNYILTKMTDENASYEEALKEAQELGFAESNPEFDIESYDAVYKLAILSSLAFHAKVRVDKIYREGISGINKEVIGCARELGYIVKLLAIGKQSEEGIEVRVHPTLIPKDHQLANVKGSYNAIFVTGDSVGELMLYGLGAGANPSGSAIVSDIIFAANHSVGLSAAFKSDEIADKEMNPKIVTDFRSAYFIRLSVTDREHALAKVMSILDKKGISVLKSSQSAESFGATIILITGETHESIMKGALEKLNTSGIAKVESALRVVS